MVIPKYYLYENVDIKTLFKTLKEHNADSVEI